jgi:hypothetical protein
MILMFLSLIVMVSFGGYAKFGTKLLENVAVGHALDADLRHSQNASLSPFIGTHCVFARKGDSLIEGVVETLAPNYVQRVRKCSL